MTVNPNDPDVDDTNNGNTNTVPNAATTDPPLNRTADRQIHQDQQQPQQQLQQQLPQQQQQQQNQQREQKPYHRNHHEQEQQHPQHEQQEVKLMYIEFSSSDDEDICLPITELVRRTNSDKPEDDITDDTDDNNKLVVKEHGPDSASQPHVTYNQQSAAAASSSARDNDNPDEENDNNNSSNTNTNITVSARNSSTVEPPALYRNQQSYLKQNLSRIRRPGAVTITPPWQQEVANLDSNDHNNNNVRTRDEIQERNYDDEQQQQQQSQQQEDNGLLPSALPVFEAQISELPIFEAQLVESNANDNTSTTVHTSPSNNPLSIESIDRDWLLQQFYQQQHQQGPIDLPVGPSTTTTDNNRSPASQTPNFETERQKQGRGIDEQHQYRWRILPRKLTFYMILICVLLVTIIVVPTLLVQNAGRNPAYDNSTSNTTAPTENSNTTTDNPTSSGEGTTPANGNSGAVSNDLIDLLSRPTITHHVVTVDIIAKQQSSVNITTSSSSNTACQQEATTPIVVSSNYVSYEPDSGRNYENTLVLQLQCGNELDSDGYEILYEDSTTNNFICNKTKPYLSVCYIPFQTMNIGYTTTRNSINGSIITQSDLLFACGTTSIVYNEANPYNVTSNGDFNKPSFVHIETIPLTTNVQDTYCTTRNGTVPDYEPPLTVRMSLNRVCYRKYPGQQQQQQPTTTGTDPNALFEIRSALDSNNDNGVCFAASDTSIRTVPYRNWTYCESKIDTSSSNTNSGSILSSPSTKPLAITGLRLFDYLSDPNYATRCYNVALTNQSRYFGLFLKLPSIQNQISSILDPTGSTSRR